MKNIQLVKSCEMLNKSNKLDYSIAKSIVLFFHNYYITMGKFAVTNGYCYENNKGVGGRK